MWTPPRLVGAPRGRGGARPWRCLGSLIVDLHASGSLPGEFEKLSLCKRPTVIRVLSAAVSKSQHFNSLSKCTPGQFFCRCLRQLVFPIILTAVLIPLSSLGGRSNQQPLTESTPPVHCTGVMSNRHVPTGDTSLISLNAVRGQGMQVIPCGSRLTRCRPTHGMAQRAGSTSLLKWRPPTPKKCHGDRGDCSCRRNRR